jgi:hypothetical protein
MHSYSVILSFLAATSVVSLPLNINLGAYSPALVVGDGEISFGGAGEAEALVNTLATATGGTEAVSAKAGFTPPAETKSESSPVIIAPAEATAPGASPTPSLLSGQFGIGRSIEPRADSGVAKRDLAGFNAALKFASDALKTSPGVELGTGQGGSGVGITVKPGGAIAKRAM